MAIARILCRFSGPVLCWLVLCGLAAAQDDPQYPASVADSEAAPGRIYSPEDFARFAPRNALDMLNRVPGFSIQRGNQGRGFGQADTNVLVNGQRLSSKSQNVFDQLRRVTSDNVERIEIVDGAALDIPGLSGQVANVVTSGGDISGSFEYRTVHRPRYAEPGWFGGEVSVGGATSEYEWSLAYNHGTGRGAGAGPGIITDRFGEVTEVRDIYSHFEGDFPSLSGSLKWLGPDSLVANLNVEVSRDYTDFSNDEQRDLISGIDQFRDFDNSGEGSDYEIGADVDFELGPGRLKLIGLERHEEEVSEAASRLIFADDRASTGNRFVSRAESGERIARAEYQWDQWGGNWQLGAEAAFNRLDQSSRLFNLEADGEFVGVPLPNSSGEVTEDRYEMIVSHSRTFASGVSFQLGIGGEQSELAQTGPRGLTRDFWRPKGSLSLAWTPRAGLDLSLSIAREVGQLSFSQFLADVDLQQQNADAGNARLKPTLRWDTRLEIKQSLGDWGSVTAELFNTDFDDYIEIIPLPGGGESRGNVDSARRYGLDWTSTVNLDPAGWTGVRLDIDFNIEGSSISDPLTGIDRPLSRHFDREADVSFRHDVPTTDWAWGLGAQYVHVQPSYRLSEVSLSYEGPVYTYGFIEHKNVFGLTASLNVFNLTDGRSIFERTVYEGLRDRTPVQFNEAQDLSVQPIFRFELSGNF